MNTAQRQNLQNTLRCVATNAGTIAELLEPQPGYEQDDAKIAKCRAALEHDFAEAMSALTGGQ